MIKFENLPSTNTPLTAENLRVPYVATALKEGSATMTSGDQITMTSIATNGDGFVLEDGGIKVNRSDIKKVLVSAQIWFNNASAIYEAWFGIKKKSETYYIANSMGRYDEYGYYTISIPPRIINVIEGDIIELVIRASVNTNLQNVNIIINEGGGNSTYLTIQEVD